VEDGTGDQKHEYHNDQIDLQWCVAWYMQDGHVGCDSHDLEQCRAHSVINRYPKNEDGNDEYYQDADDQVRVHEL